MSLIVLFVVNTVILRINMLIGHTFSDNLASKQYQYRKATAVTPIECVVSYPNRTQMLIEYGIR